MRFAGIFDNVLGGVLGNAVGASQKDETGLGLGMGMHPMGIVGNQVINEGNPFGLVGKALGVKLY